MLPHEGSVISLLIEMMDANIEHEVDQIYCIVPRILMLLYENLLICVVV